MSYVYGVFAFFYIVVGYKICEKLIQGYEKNLDEFWTHRLYLLFGFGLIVMSIFSRDVNYVWGEPLYPAAGVVNIAGFLGFNAFLYSKIKHLYYPNKHKMKVINFCLFQPIFEEICFNGIILGAIVSSSLIMDKTLVTMSCSLLYTLYKLDHWNFNILLLKEFKFVLSQNMYFAWLTIDTDSILYAVLARIALNGGYTLYRKFKDASNKSGGIEIS